MDLSNAYDISRSVRGYHIFLSVGTPRSASCSTSNIRPLAARRAGSPGKVADALRMRHFHGVVHGT